MAVQTKFKSVSSEKRWVELHKEKAILLTKKTTASIEEKIDIINSLMTSCKTGFSLTEARVKKISKFLKTSLGDKKVRYGLLPEDASTNTILFKDTVILYVEKDGIVIFREHQK